jgi:ribosome-associated toxin RatA of RatAB toxin-antitoxin module
VVQGGTDHPARREQLRGRARHCLQDVSREVHLEGAAHAEERVDVQYVDGPFRYLNNHWRFLPAPDGGCVVDFYVDFEFRSKVLQA